LKIYKGLFLI